MESRRYYKFLADLVTSLVLLSMVGTLTMAAVTPSTEQTKVINTTQMLQFTAGGHILGFNSSGIYAATGSHALHMDFMGANSVQPQAESPNVEGKAVPFSRVQYPNLWQGISLTYDAPSGSILRSTYQIEAGADVSAIQLRYNAPLTFNADGSLSIAFETGTLKESAPLAWQVINGKQVSVVVSFAQHENEVGFALGQYDTRYPLTIDPTLTWNTFLGGSSSDRGGHAIAVDGAGNIYVAGSSMAAWSCSPTPCTMRAFTEPTYAGYLDGFVAKLDPSGVLLWNTFQGSAGSDRSHGIALDDSGNVYVAGESSGEWGECEPTCPTGGAQAFVARLNALDGALQWVKFFSYSVGQAVALDTAGNVYMAGKGLGTYDEWDCTPSCNRLPHAGEWDGLIVKLNPDGVVQWYTYLGAGGYPYTLTDAATAIAVDGYGNVYVEGDSEATWGAPVRPYNPGDGTGFNGQDTFVAKLNSNGDLQWNTFLGGSGDEWGWNEHFRGIAVDGDGNVYVVGDSTVPWSCAPVACTVRAFTPGNPFEAADAYVAKLNSSGELQWNTFLGGDNDDAGRDIEVDSSRNVYVVGESNDTWGNPQRPLTYGDAFAAKLSPSGVLQWNTFLGGNGDDRGMGLALDISGNVYVAGTTDDVTWGAPIRAYSGNGDVFVAKLPSPPVTITSVLNSISTQDGWILESTETSKKGGALDAKAATIRLGDNNLKKQYLGILSFSTKSLPDTAVITKVTLKVKKQGIIGGGNPVTMFQGFMVDVKKGTFGTAALQASDFQTAASKTYGPFKPALIGGWYSIDLTSAKAYINKLSTLSGLTQIRLRFKLDDNNNAKANYLSLFSGNAPAASQPQLIIEYVP